LKRYRLRKSQVKEPRERNGEGTGGGEAEVVDERHGKVLVVGSLGVRTGDGRRERW